MPGEDSGSGQNSGPQGADSLVGGVVVIEIINRIHVKIHIRGGKLEKNPGLGLGL